MAGDSGRLEWGRADRRGRGALRRWGWAAALSAALLAPQGASAVEVAFCWEGANGWRMSGAMRFPDTLAGAARITEAEVTAFRIAATHHGAPAGSWTWDPSAGERFHLNYLPREGRFAVGGPGAGPDGQEWNVTGVMTDCGTPGLGFHAGGGYQDLCVDGTFRRDSSIDRDTPLRALAGDAAGCDAAPMLSRLDR